MNPELSPLNDILPRDKIEHALRNVKLGTAPGPDGIPYEVWKHLDGLHKVAKTNNKPYFDVMDCMTMVIQGIQTHGVALGTNFTLGYLCPIYKKKERDNVKNYCPITLLNTDYKLMTKVSPSNWQHRYTTSSTLTKPVSSLTELFSTQYALHKR